MIIKHKQGSTFLFQLQLDNPDGTPIDLSSMTIKSQIKNDTNSFSKDFVIVLVDNFNVDIKMQDTVDWPLGKLSFDVRCIQQNGDILFTETIIVEVSKTITR